jgi:type I restriction enzyme S subunit
MSYEWKEVQLGACAEIFTGFPFKSNEYSDTPNAIRLLRGDNIGQGDLRWDGVKRWPIEKCIDLTEYKLKEIDIVLAMDRPWISAGLKFAKIKKSDLPALLVQRVARLRPYDNVCANFLYYVIATREFTEYIQNVTTGTAVPHISANQIRAFKFQLPDLGTQQKIGIFLAILDDRIALLRETKATLETIAQAMFKSWFVDFDPVHAKAEGREPEGMDAATAALFPDSFEESELGLIPNGWQVDSLDNVANYLNGLALQKFPPEEDNWLPVIKIAQLRKGDTNGSDRANRNMKTEYIIQDGDVLFSWSGSLEVIIWCGGEGALNQHLFKVTSKNYPKWFYYLWTKHHLESFQRIAESKATTMGHIQRKHLTEAKVVTPPTAFVESISAYFSPLIEKSITNSIQAKNLEKLRDTLLPRLISGQLRLPDADAIIEEAAA